VELFAFVVAEGDSAVVVGDDVVGVDGYFSATARAVDDKLGDGVASGVATEAFDDFDSFVDAGAEVGGSFDEVTLVEVIRSDPADEEFVHEFFLDFYAVVDSFKKDALVSERDAGVGESVERFFDFTGEFARVVGVDGDEERVVLRQHGAEGGGDPLGEKDGDATADADELNVGDGVQTGEDFFEAGVREQQGVTAGEQDVADFRCVFEILEGCFPLGFKFLVGYTGDHSTAGAVATVGGTAVGDEKENAVWVAVDEPGDGHVGILAAGVAHFRGVGERFFDPGDDLSADRAVGVVGVDEVKKVGGDRHRELIAGELNA